MKARVSTLSVLAAVCLFVPSRVAGQQKTIEPDLAKLTTSADLPALNRNASTLTDGARKGLRVGAAPGEGPVYFPGVELTSGTIELDIRGRDVQGASFVGVAFHGADGRTYEAIYFRPFNFRTDDPARRLRAVQYISEPTHPWQKLRADHPGVYEKPVNPAPDPNGWFHARIVIAGPTVSVFIDDAPAPTLVVTRLSERATGKVGVWVGNGSGGDFANVKIRPE